MKDSANKPMNPFIQTRIAILTILAGSTALMEGQTVPSLGSADSFAILAYAAITNAGLASDIVGDIGGPGISITGIVPGDVTGGFIHTDAFAAQALLDATAAFTGFSLLEISEDLTGDDLATTLTSGVYGYSSSAFLTGELTLDGPGPFIFLIGSTLITSSGSSVNLINGANASNVFFIVGSSATLDTDTDFYGSIIASASITSNAGTSLTGRYMALGGAVTIEDNSITLVPEVHSTLLLVSGLGVLATSRRREHGKIHLTQT